VPVNILCQMDKASTPKPVIDLVERFGRNRDAYLSGSYNETQLRREFIDPLFEALSELYPPKSPYEFSVIGIEILGQVYEQFLGKVIRLTAGHQAKVEEKPEVRKAGELRPAPLTRRQEEAILILKMRGER
jgi:hypothetical protein